MFKADETRAMSLTHESSWIGLVCSDFSINLDETLVNDLLDLIIGEGVLQPVTEEDHEGQTLAELVGSSAGMRSEHSPQLVQHPVLRRMEALQMFPGTTHL